MIDMGAVLGGRATVGKHCHIGAGTVLAGVIEPPSAAPVVIENEVVIERMRVGWWVPLWPGAVVVEDVPAHTVAGVPA